MAEQKQIQDLLKKEGALKIPHISLMQLHAAVGQFLYSELDWLDKAIDRDPALQHTADGKEIPKEQAYSQLFSYQGLHAIALHRQAHQAYKEGRFIEARDLSQAARVHTGGIEIHPGARIGKGFFIDHGAGVVIGETAEIGNNVFLYHAVTLGATGRPSDIDASDPANPHRRHPKLGDDVTIANGVQILGPATIGNKVKIGSGARIIGKVHIGEGAIIAPGVEVRNDVPAGAYVVGKVPELPGIIDASHGAHQPILRANAAPGNNVIQPAWLGAIQSGLEVLVGNVSAALRR